MKKQQISISVLFIFGAALISGCTTEHVREAEDYKAMAAGYGETEAVVMEDFRRTGELINDKQNVLTMPQKELLIAYIERYYEALSELKMVEIEDLFSPQAMKQAAFHQNTWEYEIELRAMQQTDLKL